MSRRSDDFTIGRATGYRTALLTVWNELRTLDPGLQEQFRDRCRARLDDEFDASLPCERFSDEFLHGLCEVQRELGLLPDFTALSAPDAPDCRARKGME